MRNLVVVVFLMIGISSFSQMTDRMQEKKDSISKVIRTELGISQVKADSLSAILAWSSNQMVTIASNRSVAKENRLEEIKKIAAQRDKKIEALLTTVQIEKLKAIMSAHKQKILEERKNQKQGKRQ